jgi:alkylation response protein AidB-like acyl-CoA dehydrogenase
MGRVDFAEPEEHRALRAAVAGIAAKFGPRYYAERAAARRPCAELWQALGDAGFIGVNIGEQYGGGGGGLTELALGAASRYAAERTVWAEPIGTHQGVSHPLAKAKIETELAALMIRRAAWQHDHGQPAGESSNMAKYAAAEAAIAAVDAAIQAHGGNGLASEYGLIPYWGLARLLRIAPVNREMILNYVAQHSLGLPRSY